MRNKILYTSLLFLTLSACGTESDSEKSGASEASIIGRWISNLNTYDAIVVEFSTDSSCKSEIIDTGEGVTMVYVQLSQCSYTIEGNNITMNYTRSSNPEKDKEVKWSYILNNATLELSSDTGIVNFMKETEPTSYGSVIYGYFDDDGIFVGSDIVDL